MFSSEKDLSFTSPRVSEETNQIDEDISRDFPSHQSLQFKVRDLNINSNISHQTICLFAY